MDLKSLFLESFVKYLLPLLASALATGVLWALSKLATFLALKADGNKLFAVLAKVEHFVEVVVADVDGTLKPLLASAAADGVITKEEGETLKKAALDKLKTLLGTTGLNELMGVLGVLAPGVELYLSGLIEKAVTAKNNAASSPSP